MTFNSRNRILFTTSALEGSRRALTTKVRKMAELPVGFSHGDGIPVTNEAINSAEDLILLASDLELDADVFPNLDGGCAVAFYKGEARVEASISADGTKLDLRAEHGIGFQFEDVIPQAENVGLVEVINQVTMLKILDTEIWKLSASSTSGSLIDAASVSATFCTGTPQRLLAPRLLRTEKGGSQSLNSLVLVPTQA